MQYNAHSCSITLNLAAPCEALAAACEVDAVSCELHAVFRNIFAEFLGKMVTFFCALS
jgi:hypothetical protein